MISRIALVTGERVLVRPFEAADITPEYVGWLNDPQVVRFSNQRFRDHSERSCRAYFDSFAGSPNQFLSIRLREDDRAVGTMTVYRSLPHETADVGIMVGDPAQWGRGIGQEAFSLVVDWLVGDGRVRKVTAGALACNIGMIRLMERAGMSREAVRTAQELVDGCPEDVVYYARFRPG
jgi:ribosomal-protein-alanine N-acetyltransferase